MPVKKTTVAAPKNANSDGHRKTSANSTRTYTIADYRLEHPRFTLRQVRVGDNVRYEIKGDLSAPVPPIRESKYLTQQQHIEIYRWMLLNRKMEQTLENLYKQGKVDEAIVSYRQAIKIDPKYAKAHSNLGHALRNKGQLDKAIACYRKTVALDPGHFQAYHNLGTISARKQTPAQDKQTAASPRRI